MSEIGIVVECQNNDDASEYGGGDGSVSASENGCLHFLSSLFRCFMVQPHRQMFEELPRNFLHFLKQVLQLRH